MNESEAYIANAIHIWVWSGLYTPQQARDNIEDILEPDADEQMLRGLVDIEFERKQQAEQGWPAVTDCDKLDAAFRELRSHGIVAIHNAGWDKGEGFHNCVEAYRRAGSPTELFGLCYYTTQDLESAIDRNELYLGYGSTRAEDEDANAIRAAQIICDAVQKAGLRTEWDGTMASRIKVLMQWQNRLNATSLSTGTTIATAAPPRGLLDRALRVLGLRSG